MRRREFIAGMGATTAWPLAAHAQQPGRTYRIALLGSVSLDPLSPTFDELKRNGFALGGNLVIDERGLELPVARFDAVAAEVVKAAPDAIVTWGPAAGHAAQRATKSIPIVAYTDDPVESGLVASLARPGGNTTGVGILSAQLDAKRLEVLHELVPAARRIGVLADPSQELGLARVESVARNLGLDLVIREARSTDDIVGAIDALAAARVTAVNILASAVFNLGRKQIIDRMRALGLPTIYWWSSLAREGGLVSFSPSQEETNRLHARQIVRVLNGAAPAELPIVQPTKFELVINLKTAKSLDLTVPPALIARADEVIE
jgi:putative ABC transport system substrate-binding protein